MMPTLSSGTTLSRWFSFALLAIFLGMQTARAETATEAVDRVWNAYAHLDPNRGSDNFPPVFWKLSRKVAQEQGLAVIPPIMARAKDWTGEEGLIFVMLMVSLPKDKAVPVLEKYKADGKSWEKQAAIDFLIEIQEGYPEELKEMTDAERKKFVKESTP